MSSELNPLYELYEKLFNFFNTQYYNNELPMPVFMTDPSYRDSSKTNFVKFKVWTINEVARYEKGINTDYLDCLTRKRDRPLKERNDKDQKSYRYICPKCKFPVDLFIKTTPHCPSCNEYFIIHIPVKVNKIKKLRKAVIKD